MRLITATALKFAIFPSCFHYTENRYRDYIYMFNISSFCRIIFFMIFRENRVVAKIAESLVLFSFWRNLYGTGVMGLELAISRVGTIIQAIDWIERKRQI